MIVKQILPHMSKMASGYVSTCLGLTETLINKGIDASILTTRCDIKVNVKAGIVEYKAERFSFVRWFPLQYIRSLISDKQSNVYHINSIWVFICVVPPLIFRFNSKIKVILSPHGTLSESAMKISRLKKTIVWFMIQKVSIKCVDCFHATSYKEYEDIRKLGFKQPVSILPNAINTVCDREPDISEKDPKITTFLFLARLHPIKGLENLLFSWREVVLHDSNTKLLIAGPEDQDGYLDKLHEIIYKYNITNVEFLGPVYDDVKSELYRKSDVYILPSYSENFGITVLESLHHGTPVVVSSSTPWQEVEKQNCGWCVDNTIFELSRILVKIIDVDRNDLIIKGKSGKEWVDKEFSWDVITNNMVNTYNWLFDRTNKPEFIIEK